MSFRPRSSRDREGAPRRTELHQAVLERNRDLAIRLLANGVERNSRDLGGLTALHLAATHADEAMVRTLFDYDCEPDLLTAENENLLHLAVTSKSIELTALLLLHPLADHWLAQADTHGRLPLHRAVWGEPKPRLLHMLIETGPQHVNTPTRTGHTALHWAAQHDHVDSARALLRAGARFDLLNREGDTPFDLALKSNRSSIVWLFLGGEQRLLPAAAPPAMPASPSSLSASLSAYSLSSSSSSSLSSLPLLSSSSSTSSFSLSSLSSSSSLHTSSSSSSSSSASSSTSSPPDLLPRLSLIDIFGVAPAPPIDFASDDSLETPRDVTDSLQERFEEAYEAKKPLEQVFWLELLASVHLHSRDFVQAAHCLNGALALVLDERCDVGLRRAELTRLVAGQLERIEARYLHDAFQIKHNTRRYTGVLRYRSDLDALRKEAAVELEAARTATAAAVVGAGGAVVEAQRLLGQGWQSLFMRLINQALELVNYASDIPDGFAVVAIGATAACDLYPDSPLHFACLVNNDTPARLDYFRKLRRLVELQAINLGETYHELVRHKKQPKKQRYSKPMPASEPKKKQQKEAKKHGGPTDSEPSGDRPAKSFVPNGFRLFSVSGVELIGTPQQLAQMQTDDWLRQQQQEHHHHQQQESHCHRQQKRQQHHQQQQQELLDLVVSMTTVVHLAGDRKLTEAYRRELAQVLDRPVGGFLPWSRKKLREHRALEYLRPLVDKDAAIDVFDVTNALCLLPESVVTGLALYFALEGTTHSERLDELGRRSIVTGEALGRLSSALQLTAQQRYELQLLPPSTAKKKKKKKRGKGKQHGSKQAGGNDAARLPELYATLVALHETTSAFVGGDVKAFARSNLWSEATAAQLSSVDTGGGESGDADNTDDDDDTPDVPPHIDCSSEIHLCTLQFDRSSARQALEEFQSFAAQLRRQHGDKPQPASAAVLNNLGVVHFSLGEYGRAVEYYEQAMLVYQQLHGSSEPRAEIAWCLLNLGNGHRALGGFPKALGYTERALEVFTLLHGRRPHPNVVAALTNLANVHRSAGQYALAVEFYDKALDICEQTFNRKPIGPDACISSSRSGGAHPLFAYTLYTGGVALEFLGEHARAISCYERSLQMRSELYASKPHPLIALTAMSLGAAYESLSQFSRAVECYQQCLAIRKKLHSVHPHRDIAACLGNLGVAHESLGDYAQATVYHEQSLAMYQQLHGSKPHPDVALSLNNLGVANSDLGRHARGIELLEQALAMYTQVYGSRPHPDIAMSANNLGNAHSHMGSFELAITFYEQALATRRQLYGTAAHPDVAMSLNNLGVACESMGNLRSAIAYHEQSLAMRKQIHGDGAHPLVAFSVSNLAGALAKAGNSKQAIKLSKFALEIFAQVYFDRAHPSVARTLQTLAMAHSKSEDWSTAISFAQRAVQMYTEVHRNGQHTDVAESLAVLGHALLHSGGVAEARVAMEQAWQMYSATLGNEHPKTRKSKAIIEAIDIAN